MTNEQKYFGMLERWNSSSPSSIFLKKQTKKKMSEGRKTISLFNGSRKTKKNDKGNKISSNVGDGAISSISQFFSKTKNIMEAKRRETTFICFFQKETENREEKKSGEDDGGIWMPISTPKPEKTHPVPGQIFSRFPSPSH